MQRRLELDAARGIMLVWMTLTHLPTIVSVVTNQPFGFVSAAEGFIFLSALFSGKIYFRIAERGGYDRMRFRLWMRTLRLYGYHAAVLCFAFVVEARIAAHGNKPGIHNLLDFYFAAGAKQAVIDAALLIYRPPLLDILPMYIVFLFLTPIVLSLAMSIGWRPILAGSFSVWLAAQFGLRQMAYDALAHNLTLKIPLSAMGSFDLWAWQFLWVIGLYLGVRWAKDDLPVQDWARKFVVPAAIVVPLLLAFRYTVGHGVELGRFEVSFDKWHLGGVRLFNFAAVATLLIYFQDRLKAIAVRPLVLLGQASLQVFCVHLLFCFFGLTIMGEAPRVGGWLQLLLVVVTFTGLFLTALVFAKSENKTETNPPSGGVPVGKTLAFSAPPVLPQ